MDSLPLHKQDHRKLVQNMSFGRFGRIRETLKVILGKEIRAHIENGVHMEGHTCLICNKPVSKKSRAIRIAWENGGVDYVCYKHAKDPVRSS